MDLPNNLIESASDVLPRGWTEIPLAQLLEALESGSRPKGGVRGIGEGIPSIGGEHLDEEGGFRFDAVKYVPFRFFDGMRRGRIQRGDVLVVKDGATTGKVALVRDDFPYHPAVVNEHVFVCRPSDVVCSPFLFYFLFSKEGQDRILSNFRGSAQGGINQSFAQGTIIPVAPLPEQKRIVAKIEELLPRVNAVRERLIRVKEIMKRFRQSVLAAACSGRLTAEWRDSHAVTEKVSELLDRLALEREMQWRRRNPNRKYRAPEEVVDEELPAIPETWVWTNFDHCAWEITVGHVGPMKKRYVVEGIPFLRSQNVRPLRFEPAGLVFIETEFHAFLRKSALVGGEILVTRSGANTGDCCVYSPTHGEANCADLVITRPLSGLIPAFGAISVSSPEGQARIGLRETGMAQPHFNIGAMRVKAFPLPPFDEQKVIVNRVDSLFNLADKFEKRIETELSRTEKMTQAILAKAFRGELVPNNTQYLEGEDSKWPNMKS